MKFTLSWLKRHLDTNADIETIGEALTSLGLELDGLEDNAALYAPFKVAYVEKTEQHPDADRLKICTVQTADNGVMKVVCGAPNAREGMKAVFAPEGSYIPGSDMVLKKGVIRGVESCGMLVSMAEMKLSDDHDGIIEVDADVEVGTPLAELFGLDDPVYDIDLTPNRPDCAGVYGIARDLAAKEIGELKPLETPKFETKFKSDVKVSIGDTEGCPVFFGRMIKGVKNGPSPEWMQRLLKSVGLRPISALVDITNFLTMDHARPLHVYDADKLKGDITVGTAKGGEELEALNDKSYKLTESCVTISDDSGVIGLGGIVGGTSTGTDENTVNVFLESAYFDPARIARTGRDLQVISDARYRFERGVDPEFTKTGIDIATALILEICGGEASEIVQAGDVPEWKKSIPFDANYIKHIIGLDVHADEQRRILDHLGFEMHTDHVIAPSWRPDIWATNTDGRADLAEEIIRVHGLDSIPAVPVRSETTVPAPAETALLSRARSARAAMTARGLNECVTWSFMNKERAALFGSNDNAALSIANPISTEIDQMRPTILANLIEAVKNNEAKGFPNGAFCEVGPIFEGTKPGQQKIAASGIRSGVYVDRHWAGSNAARPVDTYDAKADALAALEAIGAPVASLQTGTATSDHFHPGRSGTLGLGKNILAQFGEIHPAILEEMDVKGPLVGFEIILDTIPAPKKKGGTEKPLLELSQFQPVNRDFAFIVDDSVAADNLIRAAKTADKKLIASAEIFDVYSGKGVEEGKKSLALTIQIQPTEKTLTDEEIEALSQKVIDNVHDKTGGVLRK